jgi:AraC-like DNA-binding protein
MFRHKARGGPMASVGLIRAGILSPIAAFLARKHASPEALVVRNGLPSWVLGDPELLIPVPALIRLLFEAATEVDADAGALAGQDADVDALGMLGRLICGAPTLAAALDALAEYHPAFMSTGRVWVESQGPGIELCQAFPALDHRWQQTTHYAIGLMVAIVRRAAGPTWRPREVKCQSARSNTLGGIESLANASIKFEQPVSSIIIPRDVLTAPLPAYAPPSAAEIDVWKAAAPGLDFVRSIGQIIETLSCDGFPCIETTASAIGTSVRTLQRRLAKAGFTHEQLLARSRCAIATALLEKTDSKILDIALDLGYSDHAHFTRAFRRWTGHSPQEFRHNRTNG